MGAPDSMLGAWSSCAESKVTSWQLKGPVNSANVFRVGASYLFVLKECLCKIGIFYIKESILVSPCP